MESVHDQALGLEKSHVNSLSEPFSLEEAISYIPSQLLFNQKNLKLQKSNNSLKNNPKNIQSKFSTLLTGILDSSLDGIIALKAIRSPSENISGDIVSFRCMVVNSTLAEAVHLTKEVLFGKVISKFFLNSIKADLFEEFVQVVETGKPWKQELYYESKSIRGWYQVTAVKLADGCSITIRDITESKQAKAELENANKKLHRLAILDSLTQVANRRRFDQYFDQEWRRLTREQLPLSLILCDLDYFKCYNDSYGHQRGDECLIQVAQAIRQAVKRPADLVTRYGGEEFAVILPNTKAQGAKNVAQRIRLALKQLEISHYSSKASQYVTLSLGISSIIPSRDKSPDLLLNAADQALYKAKQQGRDRYYFDPVIDAVQ